MATLDKNFIVKNGLTVEGSTIISPAATTSFASLRIPHGTAPSSPTNGDIWSTTTGIFVRVNGSTVGPLGPSGGATATQTTFGTVVGITETASTYQSNTAIGKNAGLYMPTGTSNTFFGSLAGFQNAAGVTAAADANTGIGNASLASLTTGARNVGLGYDSAYSTTTGSHNVAIGGEDALFSNIIGSHNIAIGTLAGYNSKGNSNVFIGGFAGDSITTGSNNIIIGRDSDGSSATVSNEITLGNTSINRFRMPGLGVDWTSSTVPVVQEIIPLDDISNDFDGANTRFIPNYQGTKVTINNPFRLLLTINGIMQYIDSPDYVWMSGVPRRGFFVDYEGQIQFSEPVPPGSEFDARLMPGDVNTTRTRTYPFRALDILLGG